MLALLSMLSAQRGTPFLPGDLQVSRRNVQGCGNQQVVAMTTNVKDSEQSHLSVVNSSKYVKKDSTLETQDLTSTDSPETEVSENATTCSDHESNLSLVNAIAVKKSCGVTSIDGKNEMINKTAEIAEEEENSGTPLCANKEVPNVHCCCRVQQELKQTIEQVVSCYEDRMCRRIEQRFKEMDAKMNQILEMLSRKDAKNLNLEN